MGRDRSVVIVTPLLAGQSGDRIPVGVRFSAPVQTVSETHPNYCTMRSGSFPGFKRPGCDLNHWAPLTPRLKRECVCFQLLKYRMFSKTRFISCQEFVDINITPKILMQEYLVDYVCRVGKHATVNLLITINTILSRLHKPWSQWEASNAHFFHTKYFVSEEFLIFRE